MDESKLTPEELEEMEKQFWEIVRKYRPEIFEENESDTEQLAKQKVIIFCYTLN